MATLVPVYSELRQNKLSVALFLFDGFTRTNELLVLYDDLHQERADQALAADPTGAARLAQHTTVRVSGRATLPRRREREATFLFLDLAPGNYTLAVRSPYYRPRDIALTLPLPDPRWPAFPDVTRADETLPLDSPAQPAAYRDQRARATLDPTPRYPFPGGTTLVRGIVRAGAVALEGATVGRQGSATVTTSDSNGEYVLHFNDIAGIGATVTLEASHPFHVTATALLEVVRGATVVKDFALM